MLRSSSAGADVAIDEGGMEWEVLEPHGTGKGQPGDVRRARERSRARVKRRHSQEDIMAYRFTRVEKTYVHFSRESPELTVSLVNIWLLILKCARSS
jgi:hypothetical protein